MGSILIFACALDGAAQKASRRTARGGTTAAASAAKRTLVIRTQPGAFVWLDGLRRGTTNAEGQLEIKNVTNARHTLRVRARGYAERTLPLLPAQRGPVEVRLVPTTDAAELAFQEAEELREKGGGAEGRQRAAELYRRALSLRPRFAEAHIGLARLLLAADDYDAALEQVEEARRDRPAYAEASVVEGRILRDSADLSGALDAYRRALREARGVQPEAHTGTGIILEEQGDHEGAVAAFRRAIAQLADTEPILYELLGRNLEKLERWKEAVAAYEKYLELAPDTGQASAIRSIIDQLRQQAAEQENSTPL
jgi:tetratricopeptide (TPR) repeat protein